jgi:hypothetical protein
VKIDVHHLALIVLATFVAPACGDDAPPLPPVDSGRRDSRVDSSTDASTDASPDAGVDGTVTDSSLPDGATDARDAMIDTGPGCVPSDRCTCPMEGTECGGGCPSGTTCIDNTCGTSFCLAAGGRCLVDADCPATSTCMDTPDGYACVRGSAGCADSRECPRGFACESGACVDRRVPCINNIDCPWGYACLVGPDSQGSFCEYIARGCTENEACFSLGVCRDFDGDGENECGGFGDCPMTACGGNDACGTEPRLLTPACGDYGPCETTCNSGFTCVDAWGDGQGECVPTGGACTSNTDCPMREVCAPPEGGGPPACQLGNDG